MPLKLNDILKNIEFKGRKTVLEHEAYELLRELDLPISTYKVLHDEVDLDAYSPSDISSEEVVVKILSPDITHKTDVGGVKIVKNTKDNVASAYNKIISNIKEKVPNASIEGVIVEEKLNYTHELLVSLLYDPDIGYYLSLAAGGIFTEVFKDIATRVLPASKNDILSLIDELKYSAILHGARGYPKADVEALENILLTFNKSIEKLDPNNPKVEFILNELEINPLVYVPDKDGWYPIDALVNFRRKLKADIINLEPRTEGIEVILDPETVAVIGASEEKGKLGELVITNVIESGVRNVIPINPKRDTIKGLKAYPTILDYPGDIDIAVLAIPGKFVPDTIKQAIQKKVKLLVIISGGFAELDEQGKSLQETMASLIKDHPDTRAVGPNCLGFFVKDKLYTYPIPKERFQFPTPSISNVALLSQSGALSIFLSELMPNVGFKVVVSYGNMIDADEADFISLLADEDDIDVIALYSETARNARRIYNIANEVDKPIILLKGGKTEVGLKAASSHTASMTSNYEIFSQMLKQAGILEAKTFEEFRDYITIFSFLTGKKVYGNKVAIISNAGGMSVLAGDAVAKTTLKLADYEPKTLQTLKELAGGLINVSNPTDLGVGVDDKQFIEALDLLIKDITVDLIAFLPGLEPVSLNLDAFIPNLIHKIHESRKPIVVGFSNAPIFSKYIQMLEENRIPYYPTPERAIKALEVFASYYNK